MKASPIPVSTPTLCLLCSPTRLNQRGRVWAELLKLERAGVVRRTKKHRRSSYWQLTSYQSGQKGKATG